MHRLTHRIIRRSQHQRGVTLIESMVALVVAALGVLGIVGVQMRTLNDTRAGVSRGYAIHLIEDLAERVQNNPDALNNLEAYTAESPTPSTDCTTAACDPAALATFDTKEWQDNVSAALPNGKAIVFIPNGGGRQLGVLIGWREKIYSQSGKDLSADTANLNAELAKIIPTGTKDSANKDIACPANMICHLQYIQPTQRCTPWSIGGNALYCPN